MEVRQIDAAPSTRDGFLITKEVGQIAHGIEADDPLWGNPGESSRVLRRRSSGFDVHHAAAQMSVIGDRPIRLSEGQQALPAAGAANF